MTRPSLVVVSLLSLSFGMIPKGAEAAAGAEEGAAEWKYNPTGLRDPFLRMRLEPPCNVEGAWNQGGPLQRYGLDQYQLMGVISSPEAARALVRSPSGEGLVVEEGAYIGRYWGKVTVIRVDEIEVTEELMSFDGELIVRVIHIRMPSAVAEGD